MGFFNLFGKKQKQENDSDETGSSESVVQGRSEGSRLIKLVCEDCHGTMEIDRKSNIIYCPYCGSKKLIIESDEVKKQAIRSVARQNIERDKMAGKLIEEKIRLENEKEAKKLQLEAEREAKEVKKLELEAEKETTRREIKKERLDYLIPILIILLLYLLLKIDNWKEASENHYNEAKLEISAENCRGQDYEDIVTLLKTSGFTNIEATGLKDLIVGLFNKEGKVEKISVNGDTDFYSDTWFPKDAMIKITYHSFKYKKNN